MLNSSKKRYIIIDISFKKKIKKSFVFYIETISSTNVNPDCGLFPLDLRVKNQDRDLLFFIIKKKL